MDESRFSKSKAEDGLRQMGMSHGAHSSLNARRGDIYELKLLLMAGLQQNGELISAFSRVADALERIEKHMDPQVRKGKPMKLDGMGK